VLPGLPATPCGGLSTHTVAPLYALLPLADTPAGQHAAVAAALWPLALQLALLSWHVRPQRGDRLLFAAGAASTVTCGFLGALAARDAFGCAVCCVAQSAEEEEFLVSRCGLAAAEVLLAGDDPTLGARTHHAIILNGETPAHNAAALSGATLASLRPAGRVGIVGELPVTAGIADALALRCAALAFITPAVACGADQGVWKHVVAEAAALLSTGTVRVPVAVINPAPSHGRQQPGGFAAAFSTAVTEALATPRRVLGRSGVPVVQLTPM
jgi:hypothetical protein